jgi:hypothetical protein
MIGPDTTVSTNWRRFNDADSERLRKREAIMFVYSRVTYRDIYGPEERTSEICLRVELNGRIINSRGEEIDYVEGEPAGPQNTGN